MAVLWRVRSEPETSPKSAGAEAARETGAEVIPSDVRTCDFARTFRERMDGKSKTLCLAKWTQVTFHLQNGHTHSCHHPVPHLVPLAELELNPSALHNTQYKKKQRKEMLAGERPKECDYCWSIEDANPESISDRHFKSSESWSRKSFDAIAASNGDEDFIPSYVEVSFSHQCNLRCSYCSPQVSSHWLKEIRDHGPYRLSQGRGHHDLGYLESQRLLPFEREEKNPYVDAFWKWWPELYPKLEVFRITGGEPLLSPNTFRVLEWIREHPRADLNLAINSNLSISEPVFRRFLEIGAQLKQDRSVAELEIYTSLDTLGPQADYIRNGMDSARVVERIDALLEKVPDVRIVIMCTFNLFSVPDFRGLLEQTLLWKRQKPEFAHRVWLDISYLRFPPWMTVNILNGEHLQELRAHLAFMEDNIYLGPHRVGFHDNEIEKLRRLIGWAETPLADEELIRNRADFFHYFQQHDERRGVRFLETFPTLRDFWALCETDAAHLAEIERLKAEAAERARLEAEQAAERERIRLAEEQELAQFHAECMGMELKRESQPVSLPMA